MDRRKPLAAKAAEQLTEVVSVRFTSAQLDQIEQAAEQAGLSLADYIRARAVPTIEPGTCVINYGIPQTANAAPVQFVLKA